MPRLPASDGVELHWEERGAGSGAPSLLIVPHWSLHPVLWEPLVAELEGDHRIVLYDERGTGRSERSGPYDLETASADLELVAEAAADGGPLVAFGMMDGISKAVRVAARRPDLIAHVVGSGGAPLGRHAFSDQDSMIGSDTVVGAFMQQLETDYRGAIRSLTETTNPNMALDAVRSRVAGQVEHVPLPAALARVRAWADDRGGEASARELGPRLTMMLSPGTGAGWWPPPPILAPILRDHFPEAVVELHEDGIISRPDRAAAVVRARTRAAVESRA